MNDVERFRNYIEALNEGIACCEDCLVPFNYHADSEGGYGKYECPECGKIIDEEDYIPPEASDGYVEGLDWDEIKEDEWRM